MFWSIRRLSAFVFRKSIIIALMATKWQCTQDEDVFKDEREGRLRDVGKMAVWSLSSCKPGKEITNDLIEPYFDDVLLFV